MYILNLISREEINVLFFLNKFNVIFFTLLYLIDFFLLHFISFNFFKRYIRITFVEEKKYFNILFSIFFNMKKLK